MANSIDKLHDCFREQRDRMGVAFMQPCDLYAEYACLYRPDMDCLTLVNSYTDAEPELQDQCAIDLRRMVDEDAREKGERPKDAWRAFKQLMKQ